MWSLSGTGPESWGLPNHVSPSSSDQPIQVVAKPTIWTLKMRSVNGSTQPQGSLVEGAWVRSPSTVFTHVSPESQDRMTFSKAMKKMQPLEVTPTLGSGPCWPTSLM
jgi:hypothetical protein